MKNSPSSYERIEGGRAVYLFDASSIVNLVKRGLVERFAGGTTIDLAVYECLNAVWKESKALERMDEQTARLFVEILSGVFKALEVVSVKSLEGDVFELAFREGLTVYDASYLYVAMSRGLALVTDDRELRSVASRYVAVLSSSDLAALQELGR